MKKRSIVIAVCLALCFGMFSGCTNASKKASTDSATVEKKELNFVIVPKCVHPWFDLVNKGAQAEAKLLEEQLGVKVNVKYSAPTTADVASQNAVLEQAAATHPDGIAVDPLDTVGNKTTLENIKNQGIKVILFDSAPFDGFSAIGNNFTEESNVADARLVEDLHGQGKVAIMQGVPSAPNHKERYDAHVAYLKQYPGITIVDGGIDNDNIETAQQQAAAVLAANPDLKGYLSCDASGPIGIAQAIKEAGKKGQVTAVGMEDLTSILQYVKDGYLESSASTIPTEMGSMSVLMMWQASLGVQIPKNIDTGIDFIDQNNIDEFMEKMK